MRAILRRVPPWAIYLNLVCNVLALTADAKRCKVGPSTVSRRTRKFRPSNAAIKPPQECCQHSCVNHVGCTNVSASAMVSVLTCKTHLGTPHDLAYFDLDRRLLRFEKMNLVSGQQSCVTGRRKQAEQMDQQIELQER